MEAMINAIEKNKKVRHAVVCTTLPQRYGHMDGVPKIETIGKAKIRRFYTPEHKNSFIMQCVSFMFFGIATIFYAFIHKNKFDIVFSTSSRLGTGILGYLISSILKKKFALDMRDVFSDSLESFKFSKTAIGKLFVRLIKKLKH